MAFIPPRKVSRLARTLAVAVASCFLSNPLSAASLDRATDEKCELVLSGEIVVGDAETFRAEAESSIVNAICLNSPGGSYRAGLDLADAFAELGVATYVREHDVCFSACALAFLGGSIWGDLRHVQRTMHPAAQIGFHAPFLVLPRQSYTEHEVQEASDQAFSVLADLLKRRDILKINNEFIQEFLLFVNRSNVRELITIADAATANVGLYDFRIPSASAEGFRNACFNIFATYRDGFADPDTVWFPDFIVNETEFSKVIFHEQFEMDGEIRVLTYTIHDFELYTPTAACAFERPSPDSGFLSVAVWSNEFGESANPLTAARRMDVRVPVWFLYSPTTTLAELAN